MSESPQAASGRARPGPGAFEKFISSSATAISSVSFVGMLLIVLLSIVMRVLEIPFFWGEESARYLMFAGVYIGMSVAVRERAHLGVDLFINLLPSRPANALRLFGLVVTTIVYIVITKVCWDFTARMARGQQISPALSIPMYIMYGIIFVGFALCVLESVFILWREIGGRRGEAGDDAGDPEKEEVHLL